MDAPARLLLALCLMTPAPLLAQPYGALPQPDARPGDRRAGDGDGYTRFREFFFHEARPDPLREKYEEMFGEPYPEEGFHQHKPFRPFQDVQRFNEAYELRGIAGARADLSETADAKVLKIELPGTASRPLSVRVDDEKVALSLGPSEAPRRWFVAKAEEHVVATPEGVVAETAKVDREGDVVRITFERDERRQ
jgi:HSP20 family molecular chaperone IbpA